MAIKCENYGNCIDDTLFTNHFLSDFGNYLLKREVFTILRHINTQFFIWHDTC